MKKKPRIDSNTILQRNQNQLFTIIDNEVVMLNIKHEEYLNLNQHASYIWKQLEVPTSFGELTDHLCSVYSVEREVCIQDTLDFIMPFLEKDIIQIVHEKTL
jgi:hypothetical protein